MTLGFAFDAVVAGRDSWGRPVYMERRTAPLLVGLVRDYAAHGWGDLIILEGGRTYDRQKELWDGYAARLPGYNPAAYPGTGKHDKHGRAVDFGAQWNAYYKTGWNRLAQIAPKWGFTNTEGYNTRPPEAWHWVCDPSKATASLVGAELAGFDNIIGLDNEVPLTDAEIEKIADRLAYKVITGKYNDMNGLRLELWQHLNNIQRQATDGNANASLAAERITGVDNRLVNVQQAVDAVDEATAEKVGAAVWGHPLPHPLARDARGEPAQIAAGTFLTFEALEHQNTRNTMAELVKSIRAGDVDEDIIVEALAASGFNPEAFARASADEAARRLGFVKPDDAT